MVQGKEAPKAPAEIVPSDEQILRELKQREKRREYMSTPKAVANRKKYMQKRYAETKATRSAIDTLRESDPAKYDELMAKAKAEVAAKK